MSLDREAQLREARTDLLAVAAGSAVRLTCVDLVELANLPYEGPDPDGDPDTVSAVVYALDAYWYRASEARTIGGQRARGIHYDLARYLLPFLLEHRSEQVPLPASRLRISDVTALAQILAGERQLPAATVAADRLGRLAVTCHWLDLREAATVCDVTIGDIATAVSDGLPVTAAADGRHLVRAADLRAAGLLTERTCPHGLSRDTADTVLQLLHATWARAASHGARMVGDPTGIRGKEPLPAKRQRQPRATARVYVPIERCLQVAKQLHPVHQRVLWEARLLGARDGEIFGHLVEDRVGDRLTLRAVGGAPRDVRDVDGSFVRADFRAGTKGSAEGLIPVGTRDVARGVRHRQVPLPPALLAFADRFDAIFHTDPETGQRETTSRAVPGLRADDGGGAAAFDAALRAACSATAGSARGPTAYTPHDLRASLNTDLENAGVDDRLLRHLLGHETERGRKLDVHDAHYDLGLDAVAHTQIARAVQDLLPTDVDLCVPTVKLPIFGQGTRLAGRATWIQEQLIAGGWYAAAGDARDGSGAEEVTAGPEVTVRVAACRLGMSITHLKRMLVDGRIPGRRVIRGGRQQWVVPETAIDQEIAVRNRTRLNQIAVDTGIAYHRVHCAAQTLGLLEDRPRGAAVWLSDQEAALVRKELAQQARDRAALVLVGDAAKRLGVPEPLIQTLVRAGLLESTDRRGRARRLTRDSVLRYAREYVGAPVEVGEPVVPVSAVRDVLQLTRNEVSQLVQTRQLSVITINRRQFIGSASLRRHLELQPVDGGMARLALLQQWWP